MGPHHHRHNVRPRSLLAAVLVVTLGALVGAVVLTGSPASAAWTLTWSDEFNGGTGSRPDTAKWNYALGGGGFGNQEHQFYTNRPENASMDGQGNLVITARKETLAGSRCWYGTCQYTSARLLTNGKFSQAYGRFEARMRMPYGQGIWPAFWMLGTGSGGWPNNGEIDIMEHIGRMPNTVHGTIHGPGYSGSGGPTGQYNAPFRLADDFHTYAIEWQPNRITWFFDGIQYSTKTPADIGGNRWVFDHAHYLLLNLAVGGLWPGYPDATTVFPQRFLIDYIRVYSGTPGPVPPPPNPPAPPPPPPAPNPPVPPPPPPGTTTWAPGIAYTTGQQVLYNGVTYTCRQSHTSMVTWEPPATLALWLPA